MEMLNAYLRDLLFLHDCVILPNFGGFVGNYQAAKKTERDYFTPPRKTLAFNPQLQHNDGLLANTLVAIEKVEYEEAMQRIENFVANIKKQLKASGSYAIPAVGKFKTGSEGRLLFVPDATSNFLADAMGMQTFHMMPIAPKQVAATKEIATSRPILTMPVLRRVMVAGVSGFALLSLLLNPGEFENLTLSSLAPTTIQEQKATTVVTNETAPIPTQKAEAAAITTEKEVAVSIVKKYHVIVGCFAMEENAAQQKTLLASENIQANIFRYSNSLTGVSAGSFESFEKAKVLMDKLRSTGKAPSAWVLKRQLR